MPVRFSYVAGANTPAAGLLWVRSWFECGRVISVLGVCLVLKRAELSDGGCVAVVFA